MVAVAKSTKRGVHFGVREKDSKKLADKIITHGRLALPAGLLRIPFLPSVLLQLKSGSKQAYLSY